MFCKHFMLKIKKGISTELICNNKSRVHSLYEYKQQHEFIFHISQTFSIFFLSFLEFKTLFEILIFLKYIKYYKTELRKI